LTELQLRTHAPSLIGTSERYVDDLVVAAQAGEAAAFAGLYDEYAPRVYRYLSVRIQQPADAEDLLHRVFVKVIESIGRYRSTGVPFSAWLFRIARNTMIDELRARPNDLAIDSLDGVAQAGWDDPAGYAERAADRAEIRTALAGLTDEQRDVILYRFFADLSTQETAAVMGKREGSVRALQFRAIQALRRQLGGKADPSFG
jgi:RNA polymerase sigma-70 factor (ECF subfamily)